MRLHFGPPTEVGSLAELVEQLPDTAFAKLTRSTVPLLDWWNDEVSVRSVGQRLGLGDLRDGDAWFEYPVSPRCDTCRGRGKASFTDLLLKLDDNIVAVEAKHTEKLSQTVGKWLDSSANDNKKQVLQHWLDCCIRTPAPPDACRGLVYQMVHRTASACHVAAKYRLSANVVYLLFERKESKRVEAYVKAVGELADVLAVAGRVRFAVVRVPTTETNAYAEVAREHQRRGPDALREALASGKRLFDFDEPERVFSRP